jgi:hypothetical protein
MGAAPAEDSHSRIAQVAACIRALLSIVNRCTAVPWGGEESDSVIAGYVNN